MLVIRLKRIGRKNDPSFRVVLADSRKSAKSGKINEVLGSYNPRVKTNPPLQGERIIYWMGKGAKPSPTVHNLLVRQGVVKAKKINVLPSVKKAPAAAAPAAAVEVPPAPSATEATSEVSVETPAAEALPEPSPAEAPPAEEKA